MCFFFFFCRIKKVKDFFILCNFFLMLFIYFRDFVEVFMKINKKIFGNGWFFGEDY